MLEIKQKRVIILGSTGSIGKQALSVVEKYPDRFKVVGLSAHSNDALLQKQIEQFKPTHYHFANGQTLQIQTSFFDMLDGTEASPCSTLEELASVDCDLLVSAVSGIAGLLPALRALENGTNVAIANKEAVVCGGALLNKAADEHGAKLIPIDSEHSALWQCLFGEDANNVQKLIITASGGAMRNMTKDEIHSVTAKEALNHPVWKMGKKVTIDSATLFNKGMEVAEAAQLFRVSPDLIEVVVHPESVIHGLVEFKDNSIKGAFAAPDMHLPIELAMLEGERGTASVKSIDLIKLNALHFENPDCDRFPCLEIVLNALKKASGAIVAVSAADEILVQQFIDGEIGFYDISHRLERVLRKFSSAKADTLEDIFDIDSAARQYTLKMGEK